MIFINFDHVTYFNAEKQVFAILSFNYGKRYKIMWSD